MNSTPLTDERLAELIALNEQPEYANADAYDTATALRELQAARTTLEGVGMSEIVKRDAFTVMEASLFENAPCFRCGYNGPNYYQPDVHGCAIWYHAHHKAMLAASPPSQEGEK